MYVAPTQGGGSGPLLPGYFLFTLDSKTDRASLIVLARFSNVCAVSSLSSSVIPGGIDLKNLGV